MAVKTYNPKELTITLGGIPGFAAHTVGGYADGTFVKVTLDQDQFTKVVGADGEVSRTKSNNYSGTIEVTLLQTSDSNDALSAISLLDRASNNGIIPVTVADLRGRTLVFSGATWVKKIADVEGAKEQTNRVWVLDCENVDIFVGGTTL